MCVAASSDSSSIPAERDDTVSHEESNVNMSLAIALGIGESCGWMRTEHNGHMVHSNYYFLKKI